MSGDWKLRTLQAGELRRIRPEALFSLRDKVAHYWRERRSRCVSFCGARDLTGNPETYMQHVLQRIA